MAAFNPYSAPEADSDEATPAVTTGSGEGLWRDGQRLVMRKMALLPDVCVVCNAPAGGFMLRRKLYWHSPVWYLTFFLNLVIYLIVALIVRKRVDVRVGLCPVHRARRRNCIAIVWTLCLAALLLPFLAGALDSDSSALAFLAAGMVILTAGLVGVFGASVVRAKRIDDQFAWLAGVSPAFLATLPDWRGRPS